ncbi:MAG: M48 family peptidase, partial [Acidobacteria bacterium]|nr:M48 family peptidase [Acidobacteriota bacterium]
MRKLIALSLLAFGVAVLVSRVSAAQPLEAPPAQTDVQQDDRGPVPVPEPSEKAVRYYRSGNVLWAIGMIWGFAVPLILLFTGFSAKMRDWSRTAGRKWIFTVVIYAILFSVVTWVLDLPLAYYSGFVRQHAYELSNQTAAKWWSDAAKGLMVGSIMLALVLWVPF